MAKKRSTFNIDEELLDLAKDTVVWLQAEGRAITLSSFVAEAMAEKIAAEKMAQGVKNIPKRGRELVRGRLIT